MTELKTKKQDGGVEEFVASIADETTRKDCQTLANIMSKISGDKGDMWGSSIAGFGQYHYKYASGREADWPRIGFSPRKQNLTMYITNGFDNKQDLLAKLGPHSVAKSCLYLKGLSDVDLDVLAKLLKRAYESKSHGEA